MKPVLRLVAPGLWAVALAYAAPAGDVAAKLSGVPASPGAVVTPQLKGMPGLVADALTVPRQAPDSVAQVHFEYVSGFQQASSDGARAQLYQAQPFVAPSDYHSLAELAVASADRRQIVEVGWTVDPELNGDALPHLFVFHWVDGRPTCYNGCGFVQASPRVLPGMAVSVGKAARYAIRHQRKGWWVLYRGHRVGYFPDALWDAGFVRARVIQAFGEVAVSADAACTDMGNGVFGSSRGSARIAGFGLIGSTRRPALILFQTLVVYYDSGRLNRVSFRFGGPGAC